MRLRLDLAYDGTDFHGWATQPELRTIQEELENALDTVLRTDGCALTVAGRTDAGVHARGQVAHLDVPSEVASAGRGPSGLARKLNGVLPPDVRIRRVTAAPAGFDARFSAIWRRYAYRLVDRPECVDPLRRNEVLAWPRPVDEAVMDRAGQTLLGEHDFAAFCKRREGATTIRTLQELHWERDPDGSLVGTVRADAFCHHMVRSLVGCLLAVGEGRRPESWPAEILAAGRRDPAVTVVAARGLTLEQVGYPAAPQLAARAAQARAVRTLTPGG